MASQTSTISQLPHVLERKVLTSNDAPIFPEDESLINCSVCAKLTPPSESRLCDDCSADLSALDLATLSDRLIAEEDSVFDQALRIADGTEKMLLPTRAHLRALYDQLVRSEKYAQELERGIGQMMHEVEEIKNCIAAATLRNAPEGSIH